MISTVWPYVAVIVLAAGLFPALERATRWRVFEVMPPIVLTYLLVTALAVAGAWTATEEIKLAQKALTTQLLPSLLFLLMATCDLRAILALGPRVLAAFAVAMGSILVAIVIAYLAFRPVLPPDGWKMLAALSATWTGGSANLVAVKQIIGLSEASLPSVLLADALCYSAWVIVLFASPAFAPRFDRWTGASQHAALATTEELPSVVPTDAGSALVWIGLSLAVALAAARLAAVLPSSGYFTPTSWTVAIATLAGLVLARTPLARLPGPAPIASAMLAVLVATLASQSSFAGLASAPMFVLCGLVVLLIHVALLVGAAKLFRFDLALCGIASLAQIGGPATAPVLAALYARVLVPVAVLLAMLGLVLGTAVGLTMARILSALAPATGMP